MFRCISVLIILIGFLFAQVTPNFGLGNQLLTSVGASFFTATTTDHQSPNDSDSSMPAEDEEESDTPHHADSLKFVTSQVKFQFVSVHIKAWWVDSHFTPWLLSSDFDRPPKIIS